MFNEELLLLISNQLNALLAMEREQLIHYAKTPENIKTIDTYGKLIEEFSKTTNYFHIRKKMILSKGGGLSNETT